MAKKQTEQPKGGANKKRQIQSQNTFTRPQGFTHGMVSDVDPHFQLEGSYSDAMNIRLTNSDGYTFTVENIEGNSLFVDLNTFSKTIPEDQAIVSSYPTFYDRGPDSTTITNNYNLSNKINP